MRPIDADELIKRIETTSIDPIPLWIRAEIINAPTLTSPRERGEWKAVSCKTIPYDRIANAKKCSNCGKRKDRYVTWNYCPSCGADMRDKE